MPLFIPFTIKAAVTAGAILGGTIALVNNRERVFEFGEQLFQGGADFCRNKLEQQKKAVLFAADVDDGAYEEYETETDPEDAFESEKEFDSDTEFLDSEISTPANSDVEWEHDLDIESLD